MKKITTTITCFLIAMLSLGCQGRDSSAPVEEVESTSQKSVQTSSQYRVVKTSVTSEKNIPVVIAYYFHRKMRCPTCLAIEANAARVIEEDFSDQVASETLLWMPFNLDEPGGEEFEKEFDISVSTLVLAEMKDGKLSKYKKLEEVWELIRDSEKFDNYVKNEVNQFVGE